MATFYRCDVCSQEMTTGTAVEFRPALTAYRELQLCGACLTKLQVFIEKLKVGGKKQEVGSRE